MRYNTVLGFIFIGAALAAYVCRLHRTAMFSAAIAMFTGIATLIQYVFVIDLGIDQRLIRPCLTTLRSHSGRMASNTAHCFAPVASGVILPVRWIRWSANIWVTVGFPVISLGAGFARSKHHGSEKLRIIRW